MGPANAYKQGFSYPNQEAAAPVLTKFSSVSSDAERQNALFKGWMMCCCWSGLNDPGREAISSAEGFLPVRCNPNCVACNEIFQLNPISFNLQNETAAVLCVENNFHWQTEISLHGI